MARIRLEVYIMMTIKQQIDIKKYTNFNNQ